MYRPSTPNVGGAKQENKQRWGAGGSREGGGWTERYEAGDVEDWKGIEFGQQFSCVVALPSLQGLSAGFP